MRIVLELSLIVVLLGVDAVLAAAEIAIISPRKIAIRRNRSAQRRSACGPAPSEGRLLSERDVGQPTLGD